MDEINLKYRKSKQEKKKPHFSNPCNFQSFLNRNTHDRWQPSQINPIGYTLAPHTKLTPTQNFETFILFAEYLTSLRPAKSLYTHECDIKLELKILTLDIWIKPNLFFPRDLLSNRAKEYIIKLEGAQNSPTT